MQVENSPGFSLLLRAVAIKDLTLKVLSELRDPGQLLVPDRRVALFRNGFTNLRGLVKVVDSDTEAIQEKIRKNIVWRSKHKMTLGYTPSMHIAAVVFPERAHLYYYNSLKSNLELPYKETKARIIGPTYGGIWSKKQNGYPTEGYRDHRGTVSAFERRAKSSEVQHGGIVFNNNLRSIRIVDYSELQVERRRKFAEGEGVMEANWYMDSENQDIVAARTNLQSPKFHNCLGVLRKGDHGFQYFSLNSYFESVGNLRSFFGLKESGYDVVTVRQYAAMSNILAEKFRADSWVVVGLEYSAGGTYITPNPDTVGDRGLFFEQPVFSITPN